MRVALLTSGRFTLLDLGRELSALGHDVRFYSLVPPSRTRVFGLPASCNRWLGLTVAPVYAATRVARGRRLRRLADHALLVALDRTAARRIEPCDVLIAMSGIGVRAVEAVQRRYGAKVFLERSSQHILAQREILEAIPGTVEPVPDFAVARELAGYGLADVISVPSRQVADSFLQRGTPAEKLFLNPFGVALDTFNPTPSPPASAPKTIIMVGSWSLRKGVDVLVEAWRGLPGIRLLHVGPAGDVPFPADPLFEHVDPVDQRQLPAFYGRAHVCVLASREEGLAVVQLQALACGLRLVCTTRTGGADLAGWTAVPRSVTVVPPDDHLALREGLAMALEDGPPPGAERDVLSTFRNELSWRAYAERYAARIRRVVG